MIITTYPEYLKEGIKILNKSPRGTVMISSFGFMMGRNTLDQKFLRACVDRDAKILVGIPDSPHPSLLKFVKYLKRGGVRIKTTKNCHLKMICSKSACLLGGMNLTGSGWTDLVTMVRDKKDTAKARKLFNTKFR